MERDRTSISIASFAIIVLSLLLAVQLSMVSSLNGKIQQDAAEITDLQNQLFRQSTMCRKNQQ